MQSIKDILLKNRGDKPFDVANYGGLQADEYVKDEVIYCSKCNTPRMFVSDDGLIKARCLCKCQGEARDKKVAEEKERERLKELMQLKAASLIGERYKDVTFATAHTGHNAEFDNAYIRCKRYCEAADKVLADGLGVYIYGKTGTGKTHLTACMANELMSRRKQVLFTNFFEISKLLRNTFGKRSESEEQYINKLATIDFLFIDDLGTERVQKDGEDLWLQEKIFDVINKRYNNNKPTIFTSNHSIPELAKERGIMEKTVDRISEMASAIIKISGASYRREMRKKELPF